MGWTNTHLHHFRIKDPLYDNPMLMLESFEEMEYQDSTTTRLSDALPKAGRRPRFQYEYDFGDSWYHEILCEGTVPPEPKAKYPSAWKVPGPARRRTAAASGATPTSSRRSRTRATTGTTSVSNGPAATSTPRRSTRSKRPGP